MPEQLEMFGEGWRLKQEGWTNSPYECRKCKNKGDVWFIEDDDSCDISVKCVSCKHYYRADGCDS